MKATRRLTQAILASVALFLIMLASACQSLSSAKTAAPIPCVDNGRVSDRDRVQVEGARLFLAIHGPHCNAPVLLWLHGGPGGAERPLFRHFVGDLERRFNVAYLDQRGAGLSYDGDADPNLLTVQQHLRDLERVIDHLQKRFPASPIVAIGHSWGAALGALYARDHADGLAAVVLVAPLVATAEQKRAEIAFVDAEARRRGDTETLSDIASLSPPLSVEEGMQLERASNRYGGVFHRRPSFVGTTLMGVLKGLVAPWDIPRFIKGNNVSLRAMNVELNALDLRDTALSMDTPVIFMLGRHDRHLDSAISASYFDALQAPHKDLVWFERSAHNIPFEQPETFQRRLLEMLSEIGVAPNTPPDRTD